MIYGVLGAGSWGTAMAKLLAGKDEVYLWGRNESLVKRIQVDRENDRYLPDVELPHELRATYDLDHVLSDVDVLVIAVPSHAFNDLMEQIHEAIDDVDGVINLAKGFEPDSGRRLSEVYLDYEENLENYFLLTGPSHAGEVARERPTSVVIGGGTKKGRNFFQKALYRDYFRIYTNDDLIGLEMGGALKNIIAIASGISDGLGFGVNARAALVTRGMQELSRVTEFEGGQPKTVSGLSGLGDLIVTATSDLSRNYRTGVLLAEGCDLDEACEEVGQVVEGINATKLTYDRIQKGELRTPLITQVYSVLFENEPPEKAVRNLMTREPRTEFQ
ncbi:MAG: NAD(P)H-dependent glycerol-3-phosphate dehydrogenase [bacterium]